MTLVDVPLDERLIGFQLEKHAATAASKSFVTVAGKGLTFGEMDATCHALASGLAELGVSRGQRILYIAPNRIEFVIGWFAGALIGATTVAVNPDWQSILLEAALRDAAPAALVIHSRLLANLDQIAPSALPKHLIVIGEADARSLPEPKSFPGVTLHSFQDLIRPGRRVSYCRDVGETQFVLFTSGTTGFSKGVMLSNAVLFRSPINYANVTGMTADDAIYSPLPMFHGMSTAHGIMSGLVMGASVTIDEKFSASRYWDRAAECGATLGMILTAITPMLLNQPPRDMERRHRIRALFCTRHDSIVEERFGVRTIDAFAMSETSHIFHSMYPDRRWGSVGKPNADWQVQVVDDDDVPVERGRAGSLICRPKRPHVIMSGYMNKPDVTLAAYRDLWFRTGDIVREDEEGYFYFLDRQKDRIRVKGENISSAEVEAVVSGNPDIHECAVLPTPAELGEDEIWVVAVQRPGAAPDAAALHQWLLGRLPKTMVPRYIEFAEGLPRAATGKIEKHVLLKRGLSDAAWDAQKHFPRATSPRPQPS